MKTPMSIASTKKTTASADELPKRPGVFVMASSRRPLKPPKSPSAPATPRVAAPRATTPNTLRPSVTARSPISPTTRNRADSLASHDGHASAPVRPPLAVTGSRPLSTNGARLVAKAQHPPSYPSNASPRFFHASEVNVGAAANQSAHVQASPSPTPTAKFFTADSLKPTSPTPPSHVPHVAKPTRSSLGAPQGAMPENRPSSVVASSSSHRSSRVSSSDSAKRPPSLATTTAPDTRNHVKFVYANGAEEILAPRNNGSEIGSATSSPPQLPSLPSSPKLYSLPISSPGRQSFPQSPLSSPNLACPPQLFAHQPLHSHSRRSSIDTKERHERAASIGSTIDAICLLEEDSGLDEGVLSKAEGLLEGNSQPVQSAAARIKAMEEAAADARRERKVMDLEISNASLMAINKTLEKEMRKQTAELRRYRRLSRSGRLSLVPLTEQPSFEPDVTTITPSDDGGAPEDSDWEVDADEEPEAEMEDEAEGEDEEEDEDPEGMHDEKHRAADERRLALDVSKHQALLDASAKMNVSLKRCSYMADQMISEARKALEYKVRPSDVHLGGRILTHDDEEDVDVSSIAPSTIPSEGFPTPRVEPTHIDQGPDELVPI